MIHSCRLLRRPISQFHQRAFAQLSRHDAPRRLREPTPSSSPQPLKASTAPKEASTPGPLSEAPEKGSDGRLAYPPAIRIYARSAPRLAALGTTRLVTWIASSINVYYHGSALLDTVAWWQVPFLVSVYYLPALVVTGITTGYVAWIVIKLPMAARASKAALEKWSTNIPLDTLIEIKTVRASGWGRATTQCRVGELRTYEGSKWYGDIRRVVNPKMDRRKHGTLWDRLYAWVSEPPRIFKAAENEGLKHWQVRADFVWPKVMEKIRQGSERK